MKNLLCLLVVSSALVQGAESPNTVSIETMPLQLCVHQIANQIDSPEFLKTFEMMRDLPIGTLFISLITVRESANEPLRVTISESIKAFSQNPLIAAQAFNYNQLIRANQKIVTQQEKIKEMIRLEASPAKRCDEISKLHQLYGSLQVEFLQKDIPIVTGEDLATTLQRNREMTLNEQQTICLKAALLSGFGLNCQDQFDLDHEAATELCNDLTLMAIFG